VSSTGHRASEQAISHRSSRSLALPQELESPTSWPLVTHPHPCIRSVPESVVARFSGHRTAAVFKRYNIVEEQDLKAAVALLNRTRRGAEKVQTTESAPGPESVSVDGT
jgi:hypothetical protein